MDFSTAMSGARRSRQLRLLLRTRTRAGWDEALAGHDVCVEPVLDTRETFEHPQVISRGMRLDAGDGRPTAQTGFPIRLTDLPPVTAGRHRDTVNTLTRCSRRLATTPSSSRRCAPQERSHESGR